MILGGLEIAERMLSGEIRISPTDATFRNPCSWDLRLGDTVGWYGDVAAHHRHPIELDAKQAAASYCTRKVADQGLVIEPGRLYLMHTHERVWADRFVPIIDGKSSIGRLGLLVHCTAGYGDPGFDGQYTLEVTSIAHRVRVYAGMRFCQVRFHRINGEFERYEGNYLRGDALGPVPSAAWRQFEKIGS